MPGLTVRRTLQHLVASAPMGHVLRALAPRRAAVLTYHRFATCDAAGVTAASDLRATLAYLRRHRYRLTPLRELLDASSSEDGTADHARLAGAVSVTVDDGYADFGDVAQPIFAEFDCPVTVFVSTGPVDGICWFWWDRVRVAVERSRATQVRIDCEGASLSGSWDGAADTRRQQSDRFCETLKRLPTGVRDVVIAELLVALDVELPERPVGEFSAMSWDEIRRCERAGVTIGGHTVTHPVLARCDDARAAWEITEGLRRLRAECAGALDLFAYPNGAPLDFGDREAAILRASGIAWACTTCRGYVTPTTFGNGADSARYRVPRFPDPVVRSTLARVVSGQARP